MSVYHLSLSPANLADPALMDDVQKLLDCEQEHYKQEIQRVEKELSVSTFCAMDIVYLRTRSRWTPELEKLLIEEHREGKQINICEWPA